MIETPQERLAHGDAEIRKYNRRLLALAVLTATIVLAMAAATLIKVVLIAGDAKRSADAAVAQTGAVSRQGEQIRALLASQDADRADRAKRLAAAIGELTALQQKQLDQHDADVTRRLQVILDEIGRLDPQARVIRLPAAAPRPVPARTTAPRPAPAPRRATAPPPRPPPCEQSGRSGRCKR